MLQGSFAEGCGRVRSLQEPDLAFLQVLGSQCEGSSPPSWGMLDPEGINDWPRSRIRGFSTSTQGSSTQAEVLEPDEGVSQVNSTLPTWPPETSLPGGMDVATRTGVPTPLRTHTLPPPTPRDPHSP